MRCLHLFGPLSIHVDHVIAISRNQADFLADAPGELQVSRLLHDHVLLRASWLHGLAVAFAEAETWNPEHGSDAGVLTFGASSRHESDRTVTE